MGATPGDESPKDTDRSDVVEGDDAAHRRSIDRERQRARDDENQKYEEAASSPHYIENLKRAVSAYVSEADFKIGELVQWKPFMKNLDMPSYSRPAAVLGFVDASSTQKLLFLGPEEDLDDIYIGFLDGDLDFRIRRVNSRRLTLWDDDPTQPRDI